MKKAICLMALMLMVSLAFGASIPDPFGKVKEMAITAPIDENGNHFLEFTFNENGKQIVFVLAYFTKAKLIGIGSSIEGVAYEYQEGNGRLTMWTPFGRYEIQDKDRDDFFERAFRVMRSLVVRNII